MENAYNIGLDLGGTNIAVGVVGENGQIIEKHSIPTGAFRPFETIAADMASAIIEVIKKAGLAQSDIGGVGIGIPGAADSVRGRVILAENLDWCDLPLSEELSKHIDIPVILGNDADCAALAELYFGAAAGYNSVILMTLGTGVGCGFIIDKKIFDGCTNMGTEAGHMPFVFGGETCGCGKNGCFEAYASTSALIKQAKRAMQSAKDSLLWEKCGGDIARVEGRTVFDAARAEDKTALAVLDEYTTYVAAGIAGLVNVFRPEIIVIGGGISGQGEFLIAPINEKLPLYCYGRGKIALPRVVSARLSNDAGIIGAALLCE